VACDILSSAASLALLLIFLRDFQPHLPEGTEHQTPSSLALSLFMAVSAASLLTQSNLDAFCTAGAQFANKATAAALLLVLQQELAQWWPRPAMITSCLTSLRLISERLLSQPCLMQECPALVPGAMLL